MSLQEALFPHINSVQESQLPETASEHKTSHIGDLFNQQYEQDQEDQAVIGVEEYAHYSLRNNVVLVSLEKSCTLFHNKIYTNELIYLPKTTCQNWSTRWIMNSDMFLMLYWRIVRICAKSCITICLLLIHHCWLFMEEMALETHYSSTF